MKFKGIGIFLSVIIVLALVVLVLIANTTKDQSLIEPDTQAIPSLEYAPNTESDSFSPEDSSYAENQLEWDVFATESDTGLLEITESIGNIEESMSREDNTSLTKDKVESPESSSIEAVVPSNPNDTESSGYESEAYISETEDASSVSGSTELENSQVENSKNELPIDVFDND